MMTYQENTPQCILCEISSHYTQDWLNWLSEYSDCIPLMTEWAWIMLENQYQYNSIDQTPKICQMIINRWQKRQWTILQYKNWLDNSLSASKMQVPLIPPFELAIYSYARLAMMMMQNGPQSLLLFPITTKLLWIFNCQFIYFFLLLFLLLLFYCKRTLKCLKTSEDTKTLTHG